MSPSERRSPVLSKRPDPASVLGSPVQTAVKPFWPSAAVGQAELLSERWQSGNGEQEKGERETHVRPPPPKRDARLYIATRARPHRPQAPEQHSFGIVSGARAITPISTSRCAISARCLARKRVSVVSTPRSWL